MSVIKPKSTTTLTNSPYVLCQFSLTKLIGVLDKSLQFLKTITRTVQPKANPQGTKPSVILLHCLLKISRPPLVHLTGTLDGKPLHLPQLLIRDHIPNHDPLLGTQKLLVTFLLVTLINPECVECFSSQILGGKKSHRRRKR